VIYQHGIQRVRTDVVAVADSFAAAGFVTIAIDLPLHGVTDTDSPFYQAGFERTFDLDLVNNTTFAPGPDGLIDPSSTHFANLRSLLTGRDNQRQATADLFTLVRSMALLDFDDEEGADLDEDAVHLYAHSYGAMIATPFLALDDRIASAVLAMPGGGIARLFEASPSFSSVLLGGLAAAGIFQGTPEFDQFMALLQTANDSADPVNYVVAAAQAQPLYMMELIGKAPSNPSDQTVPNFVPTAPLSGTEPLALLAGLRPVTGDLSDAAGLRAIVRYTANGTHSSFLEPALNVTIAPEMLGSAVAFFLSGGTVIDVIDPTTIE
jgi:pimeloyl-ACP methyl ester carboxylesterase